MTTHSESVTRKLTVVSAGLSSPSSTRLIADRLTQATISALAADGIAVQTAVIELREHAMAIAGNLLHGFAGPELEQALAALHEADGAVFATPIFATSYSGLFKSFIDLIEPGALTGLPVVLAATGGTERHTLALDYAMRPLFTHHQAVVVPTGLYAATSDWGSAESALPTRIHRAAGELATLMRESTRGARAWDPLALPADFDPAR